MNENLDLCKILEGCEGMELYYSPLGIYVKLESLKAHLCGFPIMVKSKKLESPILLTKEAHIGNNEEFPNAECVLFPSKDQRDWSKFIKPIKIDSPMMCSSYSCVDEFRVAFYAGVIDGVHHCFMNGLKNSDSGSTAKWKYMIPYDKFDPCNIEESLKFNIQK